MERCLHTIRILQKMTVYIEDRAVITEWSKVKYAKRGVQTNLFVLFRIMGCGLVPMCLLCLKKYQKCRCGFVQRIQKQSYRNVIKIMRISWKIYPKWVQNSSKNRSNSNLGSFWDVFGAISRPGWLQDAQARTGYSTFGAFLAEHGAKRDHFWDPLWSKMAPKSCFRE